MKMEQFFAFVERLPKAAQSALLSNPAAIAELGMRLATPPREVFVHELNRRSDSIASLIGRSGPWDHVDPAITDRRYPSQQHDGIAEVRYRVISDHGMRVGGHVHRSTVDIRFQQDGMRFPTAAEALLAFAEHRDIGRGSAAVIAFIQGSKDAFVVYEDHHERYLCLYPIEDCWILNVLFLGVIGM